METTSTGVDVEMIVTDPPTMPTESQQQGRKSPRNPPKKQKRTTPSEPCKSGKTGRETSEIWDHFEKFTAKGGKCRAKCNYCPRNFAASSKTNGTTNLWKHLNTQCLKSPFRSFNKGKKQSTLNPIKGGGLECSKDSTEKVVYNVEEIRRAIAEFVIIDEQPFRVAEGEGFKKLMAKALPNFQLPSRMTVARHCLKIYQEEKDKLKNLIKNQHVCLTSDTWTSLQNLTYMVVTAHWIDDEWNLQKKNSKLFPNAGSQRHLKERIDDWKGVVLGNEFLHVRCNAHILNLIVKDGLDEQIDPISRIRNAVKYVKPSPSRFASFKSFVEKVKLDTHGLLSLDVETRWNSTYTMLDTAVKFEKAFTRMYVDDHNYRKYCGEKGGLKGNPFVEDWKNVKAFIKFLHIFYNATLKFSGSLYVTSNCFFHEFFYLRNTILKYGTSDDLILIDMAGRMKNKFDKYWGSFDNMNMLLILAVVLDPRYKMKYVNFILTKSHDSLLGKLKSDQVVGVLTRLYNHYNDSSSEACNDKNGEETSRMSEDGDLWQSQWEQHLEEEGDIEKKTDLEKYLMDGVVKIKDFNILAWWKASSSRYPIVSKMARDVLSIPISTVASESAFSTGGRILDSYRSSLSPKTVEALICIQQWIKSPKECKLEDMLEEVQKIEEVEEEYTGPSLSID